jgi:hypothetical protein
MGQAASVVALVLLLVIAGIVARHEMDRRRYAAWEADWRSIDPRGSSRK